MPLLYSVHYSYISSGPATYFAGSRIKLKKKKKGRPRSGQGSHCSQLRIDTGPHGFANFTPEMLSICIRVDGAPRSHFPEYDCAVMSAPWGKGQVLPFPTPTTEHG